MEEAVGSFWVSYSMTPMMLVKVLVPLNGRRANKPLEIAGMRGDGMDV